MGPLREENEILRELCGVPEDVVLRRRDDGEIAWMTVDDRGFTEGIATSTAVVDYLIRRVVDLEGQLKHTIRRRAEAVDEINRRRDEIYALQARVAQLEGAE